jgi:PAS domain S-box-containing protein
VDDGGADELYRVLFDHVDNMVCTLDLEGRITSVNEAGERLTGRRAEELVGRLAVELIAPEHREEAVRQFVRRLETRGELPADESVLTTRNGACVPIEITSVLLLDDGEPAGVLGLVRDLSQQRGAEQALRESEERLRSAFESAAIGVAVVGLDGRFLEVNDSLCELVGRSAEELCALTWRDITHPDDLEVDGAVVQQLFAGDIGFYQIEKRYLHRRGDVVWALITVSLVRSSDGEPLHLVSQIQDVTERKRAEEELASSQVRLAEAQRIGQIGDWQRDGPEEPLTWSDETFRIFGIDPADGPPTFERMLAS